MSSGNEDFLTVVVLRGMYGTTDLAVSVDATGRLRVQRIAVSDLSGDHGDLDGLGSYDHDQYVRKNLTQALTGNLIKRDVDTNWLQIDGGTGVDGHGAIIFLHGVNLTGGNGGLYFCVPNAAATGYLTVMEIKGHTDTPMLGLQNHRIEDVADPLNNQDAATKKWVLDNTAVEVSGMIKIWSGSIASIPSGYVICDGTNSTPDLRDKFVMGAGSTYAVGASGGSGTHTNSVAEMAAHTHDIGTYAALNYQSGVDRRGPGTETGAIWEDAALTAGSGNAYSILNPYYALAYVMKT